MFQLQLFGFFELKKDDCVLDESNFHSNILLKLLVYLVMNRHRNVPNAELENILWKQGEIDSPQDALKNLIYRLRTILAKTFGKKDYIITEKGFYRWNNQYDIMIDAEIYQAQAEEIQKYCDIHETLDEEIRETIVKTVEIYAGAFLPNQIDDFWISSLHIMYHTQYLTLVEALFSYYWEKEQLQDADELITKALLTDAYDESLNVHKIQILKKMNKGNLAEKYYYTVEKNVSKNTDIQGAKLLRRLKQEMSQRVTEEKITLDQMKKEVKEQIIAGRKGPLVCEYNDFKVLYAQQLKKNKRFRMESYVILFSAKVEQQNTKQVQDFFLEYAVKGLEDILTHNLREIDIIARCGNGQFAVLLDQCSYENAIKLVNRLNRKYREVYDTKFVDIVPDIQRVT